MFDILCLSYFLNNSNITWNQLDLGALNEQKVQILTNTLTNNSQHNQCKILQVYLDEVSREQVIKLFQLSFFHNIQQCYITLDGYQQTLFLLSQLHQLKILHLYLSTECLLSAEETSDLDEEFADLDEVESGDLNEEEESADLDEEESADLDEEESADLNEEESAELDKEDLFVDQSSSTTGQYSELTKSLEMNCTLQELVIEIVDGFLPFEMANSIVNGVANNKSITSFTLTSTINSILESIELSNEAIQHLLKNNHTLQALDIHNDSLSSSLNIVEVNTPLIAIGLDLLHFPHIKRLQYLKLYQCYQPHLIFHSYPNLQQLDISLNTAESVNELFTILQSNTTLKALRVQVYTYSSIGNSLKDMLIQNNTIQCLEIEILYYSFICSTYMYMYLSYLTTGLSYNNSLQQLSVHIPLSHINDQQLQTYFNVISQKYNLTELKVYFTLDQSYSNCSDVEMGQILTSLYYEQILRLVTNMLKLHTTIRLLHVHCYDINRYLYYFINKGLIQSQLIDSIKHLLQTILFHPSLEYIAGIQWKHLLQDTFKVQKKIKQQQLIKPLTIVDIY